MAVAAGPLSTHPLLELVRGTRVAAPERVDWQRLVALADTEGVTPLLHARLDADGALAAVVPSEVRARCRQAYERTWARTSALLVRWDEVAETLRRAGIRAIALKGVALVRAVYGDAGLRPMVDIDVLVPHADFPAARAVLIDAGWSDADGADAEANAFRGYTHLKRGGAVLDLHRELAGYPRVAAVLRVDDAGVCRRACPLPGGGFALSAEDQILHLALHLVLGSEFGRLLNFVDVDRVVRGADVAWDVVLEEAGRWRIRGVVGYALRVAAAALGTPVPGEVLARLVPSAVNRLVGRIVPATEPPTLAGRPSEPRLYLAETLLMDRPRWMVRVAATTLFPPRRWLRFHYGARSGWQLGIARTLHPLRVCLRAVRPSA